MDDSARWERHSSFSRVEDKASLSYGRKLRGNFINILRVDSPAVHSKRDRERERENHCTSSAACLLPSSLASAVSSMWCTRTSSASPEWHYPSFIVCWFDPSLIRHGRITHSPIIEWCLPRSARPLDVPPPV